MTKTKKMLLLHGFLTFALVLVLLIAFISVDKKTSSENQRFSVNLTADEAESIVIASSAGTDFVSIYSSDAMQADQELAKSLETLVKELYNVRLRSKPDISSSEVEKEILIGNTNRAESEELLRALRASVANENDLAWGFAVINGRLIYNANNIDAFSHGKDDFIDYIKENDFTVKSDLFVINTMTREDYGKWVNDMKEKERQERIDSLIEQNNAFTQSDFGGAPKSMGGSPYSSPTLYPAEGEHPRLFITADKLDDVLKIMEDKRFKSVANVFWTEANMEGCTDGFPRVYYSDPNNRYSNAYGEDWYQYDVDIISALQNKAFAYLLTGDVLYGYEAIVGAKNMILTLEYATVIHPDMYHGPSHIMIAVAKIYDWCYDLLTEDDKNQLIAGVSNILAPRMEMTFPPVGMNAVSGHSTGPQLLRDYFMCAIAFYDEMPDWYELVGGRYFEGIVDVINEMSKGGWVSQGTCVYGPNKVYDYIISFRLIYLSTGQYSYNTEGLELIPYYILSQLQPNGLNFQSGDGNKNGQGVALDLSCLADLAVSFNDSVLTAYLYETTNYLSDYIDPSWGLDFPASKVLAYLAYMPEPEENFWDKIDTVQYFGGNAGSMTARSSWDDTNAVAVNMRIGTITMANHDNYDHGTFQIYYKGLLAGTSGNYAHYGSNAHRYYMQSTISHNGILVFNPALAAETPVLSDSSDPFSVTNGSTYYYSGSQRRRSEAGTIDNWLSGNYDMGIVTGQSSGYSYKDGSAEYGYIAGDITSAYHTESVSYLERRMLTVFTDDPMYPALFFTFDTIESTKASFPKTYLLHTVKEPEIDEKNLSVDIREGEGRLFAQNLFGAKSVEKVGGAGKAFWINGYYKEDGTYVKGKNCVDRFETNDDADLVWGRAQFNAGDDARETQMLTAMFVTDATNKETPMFEKFEGESVYGAKWSDIYAVFCSTRERQCNEFTFETSGTGLSKYYISGIEAGTWKVYVDGASVAIVDVAENGGFADFYAPSGTVTFKPGNNVIGANGGKIQYVTSGGILGSDTSYVYRNENPFPLTTNVTRGEDTFLGWYTTPSFEEGTKITEIPAGTTGKVTLYARWLSVFANEDYSNTVIDNVGDQVIKNDITYNANGKPGASFITKTDENGVNYLEWIEGTADPVIAVKNESGRSIAAMSYEDECISYEFSIAKDGDNPVIPFLSRLMSDKQYASGVENVWGELTIFSCGTDGTARLGAYGPAIGNISDGDVLDIRIVVDFKNCKIMAYDSIGLEIESTTFNVPASSGAPDGVAWRRLMNQYIAYIYANGAADLGASLRIYGFKVRESNVLLNEELEDIIIKYETNGGTLPDDAPRYYTKGEETALPTVYKSGATFAGWYTTSTYDDGTLVESVPADQEGPFEVYAKWTHQTFVSTDFSGSNIDHNLNSLTYAGITFNAPGGASFTTKTDENGKEYLEWVKGTADSLMAVKNLDSNFSTMSDTSASYSFKFRKKAGAPILSTPQIVLESDKTASGGSKWCALTLFKINSKGEIICGLDGTSVIATITEDEITELNFVIDFKEGKLMFYSPAGIKIASFNFSAPTASGAASTLEWQRLITQYMLYFRAEDHSISSESAIMVYGVSIKEGNIFENKIPSQNDIIYEMNGAVLPAEAPYTYDPAQDTELPIPTKDGAEFGGWYTTENFDVGTRVEKIPAGTTGAFFVYAKWKHTFVNTDFQDSALNHTSGDKDYAGITMNAKSGASFTTKTDENGRTYLEWIKGASDSLVAVKNSSSNFSTMAETSASYSFKFRKKADTPILATSEIILESNKTVSGTSSWGTLYLFKINTNGEIICGIDGTTVIATITEDDITELNFVIDFASGKLIFYSSAGAVTHEFEFTPPAKSGAATTLEWQTLIQQYMLYCRANENSIPADSALMIYGITIAEGNIFA